MTESFPTPRPATNPSTNNKKSFFDLGVRILLANSLIIILMMITGIVLFNTVRSMRDTSKWVHHTQVAIVSGNLIIQEMINMETGMRGYLATGKEEFLEPYNKGKTSLNEILINTKKLVSDSPTQVTRLDTIEELAVEWIRIIAEKKIDLRKKINSGQSTVSKLNEATRSTKGKEIFDHLRDALSVIERKFIEEGNNEGVHLVKEMTLNMVNQETGQRGFLLTGKEESLEPYLNNVNLFAVNLSELLSMIDRGESQKITLMEAQRVGDIAYDWKTNIAETEIRLRREVNEIPVTEEQLLHLMSSGEGKTLMDRIREKVAYFIDEEERLLAIREQKSERMSYFALWAISVGVVLSIVVGLVATLLLKRHILRQIGGEPHEIASFARKISIGEIELDLRSQEISEGSIFASLVTIADSFKEIIEKTRSVAEGDYSTEFAMRSRGDVLAQSLSEMSRKLRQMSDENEHDRWTKTGQAELNQKISGELSNQEIGEHLLSYLASYINAQIGVFYVADEDGFRLASSYAYHSRKTNDNFLKLGEGLIGQAALEKKNIVFNEVPDEHTHSRITSGIGQSSPKSIIVCPLIYENKVLGVLELGSSSTFKQHQIDLLDLTAENIAVALYAAGSRERMKVLIEDLEQKSEELQAQQEELRITNEELADQAETLRQSQAELEAQKEDLKSTNDILEARRSEIELKNIELESAKSDLEDKAKALDLSGRYKSEFLANMSHELRTPLNSLLLLSELLAQNKMGNLDDKQIEYAQTIHSSGEELLNLINDVLDLSKIEAGKVELHLQEVDLDTLQQYVISRFEKQAEEKGLSFTCERLDELPDSITTDQDKLQQVLKNLLSNAMKFTHEGGITLEIAPARDQKLLHENQMDPASSIAITVSDTGIGISEENCKAIFEAFQQADGTTSRKYGGTGLGLSISQGIAHLLGGFIHLASKENEGSAFTLFLPFERGSQVTSQHDGEISIVIEPSSSSQKETQLLGSLEDQKERVEETHSAIPDDRESLDEKSRTLLIVEDDNHFAQIMADLARDRGFKILAAADGETGVKLAKTYSPSAILLDIGLPKLDGWGVMDELKNDPVTRHIPVNFISGRDKDMRAMKMGAVGFLTKPVSNKELNDVLEKTEGLLDQAIKNILLVEDDAPTRLGIMETIGNGTVITTVAESGKEALSKISENDFDCIVLDLGLADMSGYKLLEELKESFPDDLPPVIVYTGKDLSKEEEQKLKLYTDSIIIKGVKSMERLLGELTLFLHRVESDLPKEKQRMLRMAHDQDILVGKSVLIVDDDVRNTYAISKMLEDKGLKCEQCFDGKQALERLQSSQAPDIILMDIMMPEMDGYTCIREIRKEIRFRDIPILALTAKAMKEDRAKCIEAGASDYMSKPIQSEKLTSLMRVWLS